MMKYEYVNVKNAKVFSAKCEKHREIIDEYAAKGYRFVTFIPTNIESYGRIVAYDLVFKKEEDPISENKYFMITDQTAESEK